MTCDEFKEAMRPGRSNDTVTGSELAALQRHFLECPACQAAIVRAYAVYEQTATPELRRRVDAQVDAIEKKYFRHVLTDPEATL